MKLPEWLSKKLAAGGGTAALLVLFGIINDAYSNGFDIEAGPFAALVAAIAYGVSWWTAETNPSASARATFEAELIEYARAVERSG